MEEIELQKWRAILALSSRRFEICLRSHVCATCLFESLQRIPLSLNNNPNHNYFLQGRSWAGFCFIFTIYFSDSLNSSHSLANYWLLASVLLFSLPEFSSPKSAWLTYLLLSYLYLSVTLSDKSLVILLFLRFLFPRSIYLCICLLICCLCASLSFLHKNRFCFVQCYVSST